MIHHVYYLVDPRDKIVRYVGKTASPKSRLRAHIHESRGRQNTDKKRWIAGLLNVGLEPLIIIVASTADEPSARIIESANCHKHAATIYNIHDPAKGAKDFRKNIEPTGKPFPV